MTKTLYQVIFFPPPKSEYFFSNIGIQKIVLENKHNYPPPLEVKWSVPKDSNNEGGGLLIYSKDYI